MPFEIKQAKPYIYDIDVINREGICKNVKTNLYFLGKLLNEMNKEYSPLILICGRQRSGKSYVAQLIIKWILEAYSKYNNYNPTHNTFYEPIKMIQKLGDMHEDVVNIDEAGSIMGRRQWYEQTHSALEKIIQTQGYKTMCYIFISPFGVDIDKVFTKHFDFLIRVDKRGKFKVFKIVKRYDELNNYKIIKVFLDAVLYNKKDVDSRIWNIYDKFSKKEKEKMRIKYSKDKEETTETPHESLKKSLRII